MSLGVYNCKFLKLFGDHRNTEGENISHELWSRLNWYLELEDTNSFATYHGNNLEITSYHN